MQPVDVSRFLKRRPRVLPGYVHFPQKNRNIPFGDIVGQHTSWYRAPSRFLRLIMFELPVDDRSAVSFYNPAVLSNNNPLYQTLINQHLPVQFMNVGILPKDSLEPPLKTLSFFAGGDFYS